MIAYQRSKFHRAIDPILLPMSKEMSVMVCVRKKSKLYMPLQLLSYYSFRLLIVEVGNIGLSPISG